MQSQAFNQRVTSEILVARKSLQELKDEVIKRTGYAHHITTHVAGFVAIAFLGTVLAFAVANDFHPVDVGRNIVERITGHKTPDADSTPSTGATQDAPVPPKRP
jgi:hypothetical protein